MDVEWWRVFALWEQVVMCVEVLSVAMGWGGECRDLYNNTLSGAVPSELGQLNALQILYVHTAPPEGLNWGRRL